MILFFWSKKNLVWLCVAAIPVLSFGAVWGAGSFLSHSVNRSVGALPRYLEGRHVEFESGSGSKLSGWLIPGHNGAGSVVLMHGFRGDRRQMLGRATFLNQAGYSVLLFDFQAHGESPGKRITIGYLESRDALAAVELMKREFPGRKIGVIGLSMGGAAAALASPALEVDAMTLEMVYPDIERATANRMERYLGGWARSLAPLLIMQLPLREGIDAVALRPIDRVGAIKAPKLFIAGAKDRHTKLAESRELFAAACEPKELWVVEEAAHGDVHNVAKEEYERRILDFFEKRLR
ncbi:MAG TPA: alpha/beta fold hydrolase [Blastocatellia bacterium]|nr:alpha/beta fold hydrolase [Blastocatellia bacterium]